ncbi:rhamnose-binding lectin-like [Simochromis diagramma]|uniref:rhamnose-binding lectin-like n=1 Tax=Simochromis diagramma TaxID=43689 RepID=UPI001A7E8046|nr:rhamnose-binding lectin-like [Simochromis diagramma]
MMLCSGLSSTLLLAATCSLITSGFVRASVPPPVTPISTGRVVTSNGLSVHRLSCVGGMIIVRSAEYRCGGEVICSHGDTENNVRNSCDGKTECDIKSNITYDPGVCKYLETTYDCFPLHSVTCQGSQANLQCGEGQVIVVSWANYGRRDNTTCPDGNPDHVKNVHCSSPSSTEYVTKRCNWQNNCTVEASNTVFGDPCGGTYKYLEVFYTCQVHSVTCEGSQANLQCGEGQVIVVSWANYGRRDNTTCPDGNPDHVKNVLCSSPSSTEYVTNRCNRQNNCTVEASNTVFGDFCGGTYKYLEVFYTCQVHSVTCQGSQANLQCGEGQVIVVSWANYGRRDKTTCPHGHSDSQLQNVHCLSPSSTEYVTKRCNWQNNCTVEALNAVLGDFCSGTYKYLEVVYTCQGKSVTCEGSQANLQCAPSCPPGWTWFGGRCFIFKSSMKTWTDAESSCQTLGGNLASYHSTAEYTFIRELIYTAAGSYPTTWVGGNDRETETVWKWSDGSQFDFTNWGSGQPDNSGGDQDCMEINRGGRDYVNDKGCDSQRWFVCVRGP